LKSIALLTKETSVLFSSTIAKKHFKMKLQHSIELIANLKMFFFLKVDGRLPGAAEAGLDLQGQADSGELGGPDPIRAPDFGLKRRLRPPKLGTG
jgi:hypothetical protein